MPAVHQSHAEREARELLDELAYREDAGTDNDSQPLKSTGEANARIVELRRRLALIGARFHRSPDGYVLDGVSAVEGTRP